MAKTLKRIISIGITKQAGGAWVATIHYEIEIDGESVQKSRTVDLPTGFMNAATAQMKQAEGLT